MYRYIAIVRDANINGELLIPVESIKDAEGIIRDAGTWRKYKDATMPYAQSQGAVLLSEPSAMLVKLDTPMPSCPALVKAAERLLEEFAYGFTYDALLTTGPRGGVVREI